MKTAIFVAIVLFIIGASATDCGPNEIKSNIKRCDKVCNSHERLCAEKDSTQKCFCKLGYRRLASDFAAPCVRSKDCVKCGENKEYQMCGSACPEYCGMQDDDDDVCEESCVKGCFCKESYVLKSKGSEECILESECPTIY